MSLKMSDQRILSSQPEAQFEFMPIYEQKIGKIKEEFQLTVSGIQSAMMLAIKNYDKKCAEYESLLVQLNEEKTKTETMQRQLEHFKRAIDEKDAYILRLQQCKQHCKHTGKLSLAAIGELKKEIAESIKSNGVAKKSNRNFKAKLRSFSNLMKSESEAPIKDKMAFTKKFNNVPGPEDLNAQLDQIHELHANQNIELNVTKACKDQAQMELTRYMQKNKAFIDELKAAQQR